MMQIDHYAYAAKLRVVDPVEKLFYALTMIAVVLGADWAPVSLFVMILMGVSIIGINKTPFVYFMKLLSLPLGFLIISVVTIAFTLSTRQQGFVIWIPVFGHYVGASEQSLVIAGNLFLKSLSCVSGLYFLSLSTPFMDLVSGLRRLKCPMLLIELMHLIYKMIFVLLETAGTMVVAQDSRLGYSSLEGSYRSFSALASTLLVRSFKRADALYTALEARGYEGALNVLEESHRRTYKIYLLTSVIALALIGLTMAYKG